MFKEEHLIYFFWQVFVTHLRAESLLRLPKPTFDPEKLILTFLFLSLHKESSPAYPKLSQLNSLRWQQRARGSDPIFPSSLLPPRLNAGLLRASPAADLGTPPLFSFI